MSNFYERRLFVFNLARNQYEFFLSNRGKIQSDFTPDCCFMDCRVALAEVKKIESENPSYNFTIELLPINLDLMTYTNRDFWKLYFDKIMRSYKHQRNEQKETLYNDMSVSTDWLEKKVSSLWANTL